MNENETVKVTFASVLAGAIALWTSRKLWMTLTGIAIMYGLYWHSGYHFIETTKVMPHEKAAIIIPVLAEMYQTAMWGIVTAVGVYLGFTTLDKFTRGTSSATQAISNIVSSIKKEQIDHNITITEKVDDRVVEKFQKEYIDDPSYRPIATVPDMDAEEFR